MGLEGLGVLFHGLLRETGTFCHERTSGDVLVERARDVDPVRQPTIY